MKIKNIQIEEIKNYEGNSSIKCSKCEGYIRKRDIYGLIIRKRIYADGYKGYLCQKCLLEKINLRVTEIDIKQIISELEYVKQLIDIRYSKERIEKREQKINNLIKKFGEII